MNASSSRGVIAPSVTSHLQAPLHFGLATMGLARGSTTGSGLRDTRTDETDIFPVWEKAG